MRNPASELLQIVHKFENDNGLTIFQHDIIAKDFWHSFVFLFKLSYLSMFHVNIIIGFGVMTILFSKGLTRVRKLDITPSEFCPISAHRERVRDTKFGSNVSNEMSLNVVKWQLRLLSLLSHWGKTNREGKIPLPPTENRARLTFCPVTKLGLDFWSIWKSVCFWFEKRFAEAVTDIYSKNQVILAV